MARDTRRWLDISFPIRSGMAAFPGDPEVRVESEKSVQRGDAYSVSSLRIGTHTGTHVDPPAHFIPGGTTVDQLDLDVLNGPCEVRRTSASRIGAAEVRRIPAGTERVIFRTSNSERWSKSEQFFPDYVALEPAATPALLARGVRLLGIDSLSVERDTDGRFPVHHALLAGGALILEGLRLQAVVPGSYELRFLPLRIEGGDGGPGRALLRPMGPSPG